MEIRKFESYEAVSRAAAELIAEVIREKDDAVLGLATGSTPVGCYKELIAMNQEGTLDFSKVRTFNLDEYRSLSPEDPASYRHFMNEQLFDHINIPMENTNVPDGLAEDMDTACRAYEEAIENAGGIDLQVLGIGHDGHIGFNEPAAEFPVRTHVVKLNRRTIEANARFFGGNEELVPKEAVTMGVGTIMKAKKILLIVTGEDKAQIVRGALTGPVSPLLPAAALQLYRNLIVLGDEAALSLLPSNL